MKRYHISLLNTALGVGTALVVVLLAAVVVVMSFVLVLVLMLVLVLRLVLMLVLVLALVLVLVLMLVLMLVLVLVLVLMLVLVVEDTLCVAVSASLSDQYDFIPATTPPTMAPTPASISIATRVQKMARGMQQIRRLRQSDFSASR